MVGSGYGIRASRRAGALFLMPLRSILTALGVPPSGRQVIGGMTLLALMLICGRQRRLRG
jgi:MYXO-CTERM domain-containing protein